MSTHAGQRLDRHARPHRQAERRSARGSAFIRAQRHRLPRAEREALPHRQKVGSYVPDPPQIAAAARTTARPLRLQPRMRARLISSILDVQLWSSSSAHTSLECCETHAPGCCISLFRQGNGFQIAGALLMRRQLSPFTILQKGDSSQQTATHYLNRHTSNMLHF
eukprot:2445309-Pleurochrysis_carterae.AAC.2